MRRSYSIDHRPLLLVGAKGSGKTSLAKLVVEQLEADREVLPGKSIVKECALSADGFSDVLYHDVGRIDADARLSGTKERMTGWVEEATRRRPCVLILDGMDSLLSPEHEVRVIEVMLCT